METAANYGLTGQSEHDRGLRKLNVLGKPVIEMGHRCVKEKERWNGLIQARGAVPGRGPDPGTNVRVFQITEGHEIEGRTEVAGARKKMSASESHMTSAVMRTSTIGHPNGTAVVAVSA